MMQRFRISNPARAEFYLAQCRADVILAHKMLADQKRIDARLVQAFKLLVRVQATFGDDDLAVWNQRY